MSAWDVTIDVAPQKPEVDPTGKNTRYYVKHGPHIVAKFLTMRGAKRAATNLRNEIRIAEAR